MNSLRKFFKFEERKTDFQTEIIGGLVTFLAMSYILAVNPAIIGFAGIPLGGAFLATAIGAAIATLVMAFAANYPVALAPGMGVNAFFTFTIVLSLGYTWQEALAASFIGGLIFVAISFTPFRKKLIDSIPDGLKAAIGVGIGFFIAFVGLQNGGVIVPNPATGVSLGDFSDPSVLVTLFGIVLAFAFFSLKGKINRFAFILSILCTAVLYAILAITGVVPSISVGSYEELATFGETFGAFIGGFETLFQSSEKLVILPFIVFALLFVDIFDTAGTLVAVTNAAGIKDEKTGEIPNLQNALLADAIGTLISSTLGTPEITSYVESATGVESGARTGFSNLIVAGLFLLSIALFPFMGIFFIFPVTAMALVLVGVLMATQIKDIDWSDKPIALASFMTIIGMMLSYSVADGIAFGFITYSVAMLAAGKGKQVNWLIYVLSLLFIFYFALAANGYRLW